LPGSTLSTGKSTMCVRLHVRSQRVSEGGLKVALACTSFQCCKLALWIQLCRDPASNRDPACIRDPASICTNVLDSRLLTGTRRVSGTRLVIEVLRYLGFCPKTAHRTYDPKANEKYTSHNFIPSLTNKLTSSWNGNEHYATRSH